MIELGSDKIFSMVNKMAVKTDNIWLGKERLRDFSRSCVTFRKSSHARITSVKSQQEELLTHQGKAMIGLGGQSQEG